MQPRPRPQSQRLLQRSRRLRKARVFAAGRECKAGFRVKCGMSNVSVAAFRFRVWNLALPVRGLELSA